MNGNINQDKYWNMKEAVGYASLKLRRVLLDTGSVFGGHKHLSRIKGADNTSWGKHEKCKEKIMKSSTLKKTRRGRTATKQKTKTKTFKVFFSFCCCCWKRARSLILMADNEGSIFHGFPVSSAGRMIVIHLSWISLVFSPWKKFFKATYVW